MAYRFKADETVEAGFLRVAREQIAAAREELGGQDRSEAVHDARKRLKKIRALLRLVRGGLGEATFRAENARFRTPGQALSELRDSEAVVETLDKLRRQPEAADERRALAGLRRALARRRDRRLAAFDAETEAPAILAVLDAAEQAASGWGLSRTGFGALAPGLGRTYRRGRDAFRAAVDDPTPERLHAWRRRTKDLWYQMRLLQPACPELLKATAGMLETLADRLGDDHDLAVLHDLTTGEPPPLRAALRVPALPSLIARRQDQLRAEAEPLGRRLYAERPKPFIRRVGRYWKAWRAEP